MAKKKVLKKKKVKMKVETRPIEESAQMSEAIAEEITSKAEELFNNAVLKANHARQSEINNRVQLVMSFNPQISRNGKGEWSVCIGYDNTVGLFTTNTSVLGAMLDMFEKLN